jgi:glycosyltransferase involved in cell wall biosynthesis
VVEFNVASPTTPRVVPEPHAPPAADRAPAPTAVARAAPGSTGSIEPSATPRTGRAPVSVVIPTLNEASNLPSCLEHLAWADEVFVVDSGSTDDTARIAERHGAKVVQFKWDGQWPKKKNWALRNLPFRNDWVLIVDADEWITAELAREIQQVIREPKHVGYYVNRKFIFMGRWIKHCGYYPSWNLRLLKRGAGEYEQLTGIGNTGSGDNEVHEHIAIRDGSVGYLDEDMLHFAFPNIHTFMEKHNRYSNWEAAVQFKGVEHGSAVVGNEQLTQRRRLKMLSRKMPFRPTLRFFYSYIWKGGFLDGQAGYVFCRLLAIYEYLSVAKYQELHRAQSDALAAHSLGGSPLRGWSGGRGGAASAGAPDGVPTNGAAVHGTPTSPAAASSERPA